MTAEKLLFVYDGILHTVVPLYLIDLTTDWW